MTTDSSDFNKLISIYENPVTKKQKEWAKAQLVKYYGLGDYIPGQDDGEAPAKYNNHE